MAINLVDTWQCWWTLRSSRDPEEMAMFHVSTEANVSGQLAQPRIDAIFDAMVAYWTSVCLTDFIVLGNELEMVHINFWDTTLLVPGWRELSRREFVAGTHVSAGDPLPNQLAIAITLKTLETVPGNRQSRYNRFYLPYIAMTELAAGRIPLGTRQQILASLETLNAAIGANLTTGLLVVSEKQALGFGTIEASVGDVMDTQRRRRNQLTEIRTAAMLS